MGFSRVAPVFGARVRDPQHAPWLSNVTINLLPRLAGRWRRLVEPVLKNCQASTLRPLRLCARHFRSLGRRYPSPPAAP